MNGRKKIRSREQEIRLVLDADVRKANTADFFVDFSRFLRPWLRKLTDKYMEEGRFPVMACWLLPSYYREKDDMMVAAAMSLIIADDRLVVNRCRQLRLLMGEHPWQWFNDRWFVQLGVGDNGDKRTAGVLNWKIADTLNLLWEGMQRHGRLVLTLTGADETKIRLTKLVMYTTNGIGLGIMDGEQKDLFCPITKDVISLLCDFFPEWRRYGNADEALRLFGMDRDIDFFYAALAWKDMQKRKPKECSRLATIYRRRYKETQLLSSMFWGGSRKVLFDID